MSAQLPKGDSWHMLRTLAGVSLLSGMLIVLAYETTLPRILANRQRAIEEAVFRVLPRATTRATYVIEGENLRLINDEAGPGAKLYAGYDTDGKLIGVAIEGAGQGYQDIIRVLYGYAPEKQATTGFTVVESKETPGLGDKIGFDANFLKNFDGLDMRLGDTGLQNGIVAVKHGAKRNAWEIDGISGATVSSKAVGRILHESATQIVPLIVKHRQQLEDRQ